MEQVKPIIAMMVLSALAWLVAYYIALRDRAERTDVPPTPVNPDDIPNPFASSPWWRQALFVAWIALIVTGCILIVMIMAPFAVVIWAVHGLFWLRWKLFGVPIPALWPTDRPASDASP